MHINSEQSVRSRVPKGGFGFLNFPQNRDTTLVVRVPIQGRAHAPRGSLQQPDPEPGLQLLDYLGGRRSRNLEILRGPGETAPVNDSGVQPHHIQSVHIEPYCSYSQNSVANIAGIIISWANCMLSPPG